MVGVGVIHVQVIFVRSKYGYVLIFLMHYNYELQWGIQKWKKVKGKLKNMGNQSRVLRKDGNSQIG